ncbi:hypothetical protein QFZ36_000517 [Pseudarthrobacter siccitolerans]|uniref:Uncharacterized protein n=1 Tax=Pseudarthrobacter siccitolerans TaxID=861266 RepID=A0ABU0PG89_9MICC|nr:hypothetical protein [Pseudarthrobacter siccitolerans]MDQ0672956.1 hypothetical protein [Pseudarthrobacter siccitolerans]
MESLVVTLGTAKKRKAAGFPQDSHFVWEYAAGSHYLRPRSDERYAGYGRAAAPTAQEIADQVPHEFEAMKLSISPSRDKGFWLASYPAMNHLYPQGKGATMAESLASLWLRLQEAK